MIPKPIHEIGVDDIQALLDNNVPESKTIEYKREMPAATDGEKAKFLAAVSSFANTSGGDLLLGVEEQSGLPKALRGIEVGDVDQEKLRLEQVVKTGLEPRLPVMDIQPVALGGSQTLLVIRAPQSWVAPHRVLRNGKFYGRHSAGKYELDVGELRTAFTLSEAVADRIRSFRADRIAKVYAREAPVPLMDGGVLVLHLLPLFAFTGHEQIDLSSFNHHERILMPMGRGIQHLSWHFNLDGFVAFDVAKGLGSNKYTQFFRSGAVEATRVLEPRDGKMFLPSIAFEQMLIELLNKYLALAPPLGIRPPIYAFLSMVGVRGYELGLGFGSEESSRPLMDDLALLPEVVVEDFEADAGRALRPAFDMIWNAFGLLRSLNYDADGNWRAWQ